MRVEPADAHARPLDAEFREVLMGRANRRQHAFLFHAPHRVDEGDVRRDVNHAQLGRGQQHKVLLRSAEVSQQPGMPVEGVSGEMHGLLVEGARHDRFDLVRERQLRGPNNRPVRRFARIRVDGAHPHTRGVAVPRIQHVDHAVRGCRRLRVVDRPH